MRMPVILGLCVALQACVTYRDITKVPPVHEVAFNGSHLVVAQCVALRLSGKTVDDPDDPNQVIVFNSVKSFEVQGISHYAVTIRRTGPKRGELKFHKLPTEQEMDAEMVQRFWTPVKRCAEQSVS